MAFDWLAIHNVLGDSILIYSLTSQGRKGPRVDLLSPIGHDYDDDLCIDSALQCPRWCPTCAPSSRHLYPTSWNDFAYTDAGCSSVRHTLSVRTNLPLRCTSLNLTFSILIIPLQPRLTHCDHKLRLARWIHKHLTKRILLANEVIRIRCASCVSHSAELSIFAERTRF
jgi:hypothetical protein